MATNAMTGAQNVKLPFPMQQSERVILLCRRHWIHLWPKSVVLAIYALVPPLVISLALAWADQYEDMVARIFWVVAAVWLLYWALRIFLNWYRYKNDIWVITNQRLVDSVKTSPLNHRLSTADLVNVQDMTVERRGILQTLLNYGDIVCETAADGGEFVLAGIPRPQDVQLLVDRERDQERKGR